VGGLSPQSLPMKIGYSRISSGHQYGGEKTQIAFLQSQGVEKIYTDTASGKKRDRTGLDEMLRNLRAGDEIITKSIDRIARSLRDLLDIIEQIRTKKCFITIVEQNISTKNDNGITELLIGILGSIASWEISMQRKRCDAGIARRKAEGKKFGRPRKTNASQDQLLLDGWRAGKSWSELAKSFGISKQSVYRRLLPYIREERSVAA